MIVCFPSRTTSNPTFRSARIADLWLIPGNFGILSGDLYFTHFPFVFPGQLSGHVKILGDGVTDVR